MKKILKTALLITCVGLLQVSGNNNPRAEKLAKATTSGQEKTKKVNISGKIENASTQTMHLYSRDRRSEIAKIDLDSKGKFDVTIEVGDTDYVLVDEKRNVTLLYLEKDTKPHIEYDVNDYKRTIQITGENITKTLLKNERLISHIDFMKEKGPKIYTYTPDEFLGVTKAYKTIVLNIINKYKGKIPADFLELEKGDLHYLNFIFIDQYADYYKAKKGDLPEEINKILNDVDLNNEELLKHSSNYESFLHITYAKYANTLRRGKEDDEKAMLEYVASTIDNEYVKSFALATWFQLTINNAKDKKALYDKFMELSSDKAIQDKITAKFNQVSKFDVGKPSPVFENYEKYGGGNVSLTDLRGKYVFIDFWATWCGPCIQEFPHIKKLEEAYHGKNIVFVGVSLDKKSLKTKWQEVIAEHKLEGVQLLADNALKSQFAIDYNITTIPRFILIDPEGKIVSSNAPRPSDPELRDLLNGLDL